MDELEFAGVCAGAGGGLDKFTTLLGLFVFMSTLPIDLSTDGRLLRGVGKRDSSLLKK